MVPRRLTITAVGILGLTAAAAGVALAGGAVEDKLRTGEAVTVQAGEVVPHDLYVFGGDVIVNGTVEGDLVAASGSVTVGGRVEGDLVAGTGQLVVTGVVDGDARVGAGVITIAGLVGEDLLAGAGEIEIAPGGAVGEDLIFGAGDVHIAGDVAGNVYGSASTYSARTGSVGGTQNVTLDTGEPTGPAPSEPARIVAEALRHLLTVVFFGALGLWLIPNALRASEGALRRRPLASVGLGLFVLAGFIVQFVAVILLVVLVAFALASVTLDALAGIAVWAGIVDLMVSTFVLVVAASFVVDAVVGLALAQLVARGWAQNRWQELALLIGGAAVIVAVSSLPGIGGLVKACVIVLGLGALTVAAAEAWQRRHPPATPSWGEQAAAPPSNPIPG